MSRSHEGVSRRKSGKAKDATGSPWARSAYSSSSLEIDRLTVVMP